MRKLLLVLTLLLLAAFGLKYYEQNRFAGEVNWGGRGNIVIGYALDRSAIHLKDFEGKYLWVSYGSKWCPLCHSQTPILLDAFENSPQNVQLLFVLMAGDGMYQPATNEEAQSWADENKVQNGQLAYGVLLDQLLPGHELFSPEGKTLLRKSGVLSRESIRDSLQSLVH